MAESVLIIAAHPDDEVLGCGATAARLSAVGKDVHVVIMSGGATSRYANPDEAPEAELAALKKAANEAAGILGIRRPRLLDFPDNRFDSVPLLEIVHAVEGVVEEIGPEWIFTHSPVDLNVDHRKTYEAVLTATRPVQGGASGASIASKFPPPRSGALAS